MGLGRYHAEPTAAGVTITHPNGTRRELSRRDATDFQREIAWAVTESYQLQPAGHPVPPDGPADEPANV